MHGLKHSQGRVKRPNHCSRKSSRLQALRRDAQQMHIPNHWAAFCWYSGIPKANLCTEKRDGLALGVRAANGILTLFIPHLAVNTRGGFLSQREQV